MTKELEEYFASLDKEDLLSIRKYGLIESNAPKEVTVEDIYYLIGCQYICENCNVDFLEK